MSPSLSSLVTRLHRGHATVEVLDEVVSEEPLELRVEGKSIAVIMRTPGHDEELAAGFLLTEGVLTRPEDVFEISVCPSRSEGAGGVVDVLLTKGDVDWAKLTRHVFASSSCGVCGKATIDAIFQSFSPLPWSWTITGEMLWSLPDKLRAAQSTFEKTGGLHASALFDAQGSLIVAREDVGRHSALDKVLGYAFRNGLLPLKDHVLLVSGRVSFEIMQKALAGGIGLVAAVSAPSSLAVQFAQESGQTLVGFLRGDRMNVYAGAERIVMQQHQEALVR
ncbi:MAG: formate dehydrogenase accessory sulfurtransferase FdhD [Verrucomicrobium sp.]|nr:formate dehydrogenase accessory sulfurtransferase FdhD [Verrucomicrobium sp.]